MAGLLTFRVNSATVRLMLGNSEAMIATPRSSASGSKSSSIPIQSASTAAKSLVLDSPLTGVFSAVVLVFCTQRFDLLDDTPLTNLASKQQIHV